MNQVQFDEFCKQAMHTKICSKDIVHRIKGAMQHLAEGNQKLFASYLMEACEFVGNAHNHIDILMQEAQKSSTEKLELPKDYLIGYVKSI